MFFLTLAQLIGFALAFMLLGGIATLIGFGELGRSAELDEKVPGSAATLTEDKPKDSTTVYTDHRRMSRKRGEDPWR
jgi:hypothetical protein